MAASIIEFDFQAIDGLVVLHDAMSDFQVTATEGCNRILELVLHHAAHGQHLGADLFQILVILFRGVIAVHETSLKEKLYKEFVP